MMSFIFLSYIINVVRKPELIDPKIFLWIPAFAVAIAVKPNGSNTLLVSGVSAFFINGKRTFSNSSRNLTRKPPDCIKLDSRIFHNFTSFSKLFAKALKIFRTCLAVNNSFWRTLVSSVPIMLYGNLRVTSVAFSAIDFNSSSWKSNSLTFELWYSVILY